MRFFENQKVVVICNNELTKIDGTSHISTNVKKKTKKN